MRTPARLREIGRQRRYGSTAPILAVVVIGLAVACGSPRTLPWPSGANGNQPSTVNTWSEVTGRAPDVAIVFTDRRDWHHITDHEWPVGAFKPADFPGQLSVAQPLFPRDGNEQACATGEYDDEWTRFGRTLTKYHRGDAFVRLGWEFNGDWFWWQARDPETWKQCFRKAATAIRSAAPEAQIEWNISAHRDRIPSGSAGVWDMYPGNDYVDVVSIDAYDSHPASVTDELFDRQCRMPAGMCTVIDFARQNGKRFAVPEWGLVRSEGGGGDNPRYIDRMYDTFVANADILAYEAYFNNADSDNVGSSLHEPVLNPVAAQRYRDLFGPNEPTTAPR